ncbi:signal peptidase II [Amaricoccus macauensis]|uniref:signal peptidase II n=1 Tax=Amaricoccus macauensis TaxID=57001 RepID=UPI003C7DA1EE
MLLRALAVALPVFLLDRLSKYWVVEVIDLRNRLFVPVLDPWLNFTMAWNEGINFGLMDMGGNGRWVLIGLALAIVLGLAIWIRKQDSWLVAAGAGAIMGGALGNVWDRIQYGAVADFLNMSCCGIQNPFAFNIADAAIFGGAIFIALFVRSDDAPR